MQKSKTLSCIQCGTLNCHKHESKYPKFCLTTNMDEDLLNDSLLRYKNNDIDKEVAFAAAEVEGEYYGKITRIEEIIVFAQKINAQKIGIASCVGLSSEAKIFAEILQINDIEAVMAVCKIGSTDKTKIGIKEETKIRSGNFEPMCNPILQAKYLNSQNTDLNVIVGLCVGHDSLFIKYSNALITNLVVKDRVLGHNPIAGLYTAKTYYKKLLQKR